MNVSFTSSTLTNSTVVDSTTSQLLFELSTPFGLHYNTTQGRTMRVSEWLPKKSMLSSSRTLEAPNGRSYRWETGGMWKGGWQLFDCQTEVLVASVHSKKLFSSKKMNMDVVQDVLPILDVIVLSFVICELMKKREEDVTVNASTYMNA